MLTENSLNLQFKSDQWNVISDCWICIYNLKKTVLIKFWFKDFEYRRFLLWYVDHDDDNDDTTRIQIYTGTWLTDNDDFNNKRIHFFIKLLISHTLFSKRWCLLCVRNEWRQGRTAILTQVLLSTIAALLPHLGWVAQPWVTEGRKALSLHAGSHAGILSLTDSNCPGTWLYYFLMSTCFCCSSAYLHRCIS